MKPWVPMLFLAAGLALGAPREPLGEADLRFWMEDMVVFHQFSDAEIQQAAGMSPESIREARLRLSLPEAPPPRAPGALVTVLPYPGGRHPRLGFFEGAVDPVRETKLSVFTPWDARSYVVVDVPEALWSNLGLTYLAHTHLPTIWDVLGVGMERREWSRRGDGSWTSGRTLPNGIAFGVRARPTPDGVDFRWWVRNGTSNLLTGLRAQVCVLLGRAGGFEAQSATNKVLEPPLAAVRDSTGRRWILTGWEPLDRVWQNPPVPCIHADPRIPDCPPGETREARGGLWFYEGNDPAAERSRRLGELRSWAALPRERPLEPIPDKLVVLTFDDSVASQFTQVRPLLKEHGFGATFFITEGFSFRTNKTDYLTWDQIAELSREGFEIGNHTASHLGVLADTLGRLRQELELIQDRCAEHGIPRPVSFAYPGNAIHPGALPLLASMGFRFARRGAQPEFAYETGRGVAYDPREDHPLLVPTAGDARPTWTLDDVKRAVSMARAGRIAVLQFHGVPDRDHPWVNTPVERFAEYLDWLKAEGYQCIAMRDLERYVDPGDVPAEPWAVIARRQAALSQSSKSEKP
ncbi:MAG: polysaccharide deacetylase family protein [Verrucomicrobiota bacterium]